ncbi:lipid A biosynthesis palmitoleoyltransferase [Filimonas sp.]|nr:lipid A biosynthesis palmitoleoyltransferase [Filimonas sp.]
MYYFIYPFLYLISLLPFRVLYSLSDFIYLMLYKIFGYRKKVVHENLTRSFPEKSAQEIQSITDKYYKNLCDSIVETIKLISISKKELDRRMTCNWEVFDSMTSQNRNGQGYMSHQFNWEWGTLICNWHVPRRFTGLYMPLTNAAFEKLFLKIRGRAGMKLIRVQDMQKEMAAVQNEKTLWGFIADQNPSDPKRVSWNDFLNRKTAFFKGPEFVARRYNNLVYFGEFIKLKRGYYEIKMKLAFEHPKETKEGEITEAYVRFLEDSIKRQPENWVWSHRRWKHIYPENSH